MTNRLDLLTWGHPSLEGITPLFACINDHLFPIGTAFFLPSNPILVACAEHVIRHAMREERDGDRLVQMRELPRNLTLKDVDFFVLHQRRLDNEKVELTPWHLDPLHIVQPTDLVIGSPSPPINLPTVSFPLSFEFPRIGSKVRCFGYCDSKIPDGGIPISSLFDRSFDWQSQYNHRFRVVEGTVRQLFTQRFGNGYLPSPCFSIDVEIDPGLSGGPVLTASGAICGVNSAGATDIFNEPTTLISMLRPLLDVSVTLPNGATQQFIDLALSGNVLTDGSHERASWTLNEDGSRSFDVWVDNEDRDFAHDDCDSYQDHKGFAPATGPQIRRMRSPQGGSQL